MASFHPWELAWKEGRWYEVSPAFRPVIEFSDYLKRVGGRTVLDLGCGAGRHSIYLSRQGFRVVGFDISLSALRKLKTRLKAESVENVEMVNSEMSKLPFADGVFDAVISTNVLHHTLAAGIEQAVEEVHRVTNTGAEGFLMTLSEHDYKNGTGRLLEAGTYVLTEGDEEGIVHHFFSEEELLSHFGKFRIISVQEELVPIEKGTRGHFHLRFRKDRAGIGPGLKSAGPAFFRQNTPKQYRFPRFKPTNLRPHVPRSDSPPSLSRSTPVTKMVLGTIQPPLQKTSPKHAATETHLAQEGSLTTKFRDAKETTARRAPTRDSFPPKAGHSRNPDTAFTRQDVPFRQSKTSQKKTLAVRRNHPDTPPGYMRL